MIQRQCPKCSSELVRAKRADQPGVPAILHAASPGWRCSVCGGEFTSEQIRDSKRAKAAMVIAPLP
jgi:DNA-directed RNA polymerase subunit RPC12/RpoP